MTQLEPERLDRRANFLAALEFGVSPVVPWWAPSEQDGLTDAQRSRLAADWREHEGRTPTAVEFVELRSKVQQYPTPQGEAP